MIFETSNMKKFINRNELLMEQREWRNILKFIVYRKKYFFNVNFTGRCQQLWNTLATFFTFKL